MNKSFFLFIIIYFPHIVLATNIDSIQKLKDGALLVRLQTNQNLINHYLIIGENEKAQNEKEKQYKKNQNIIKNFKTTWTLCPVYFFYSNHSNEIRNKNLSNVFSSEKIKINKQEQVRIKNNFLITYIGQNTGTLKFHCLVLVNPEFNELPPPLPRYVRTYKGFWFLKRKLSTSINILHKKIQFHLSRKE